MFFAPEAKPRDVKHTVGLISIQYFDNKHILNAQSEAEDIQPVNLTPYYGEKCSKSIECRNDNLGVFCARGKAEGFKTHRWFDFY